MASHRKYDKPIWLRWPGKWPFKYIWYSWNPFKIVDSQGKIIADYFKRKRGKQTSMNERIRRSKSGEGQKKWFSQKLQRSMDFSGDSN